MSILDSPQEVFSEENLPVYVLLGLLVSLRRLDALLLMPREAGLGSPVETPPPAPLASGSSHVMDLLLGVVSLRQQLTATLRLPPPDAPSQEREGARPSLRELLR